MIRFKEPKTWAEIETFDDILSPEDIELISELETENLVRCPYLKKIGSSWFYCGIGLTGEVDAKPSPSNPVYQRHVGVYELQFFCMGNHDICIYKSGKMKHVD